MKKRAIRWIIWRKNSLGYYSVMIHRPGAGQKTRTYKQPSFSSFRRVLRAIAAQHPDDIYVSSGTDYIGGVASYYTEIRYLPQDRTP